MDRNFHSGQFTISKFCVRGSWRHSSKEARAGSSFPAGQHRGQVLSCQAAPIGCDPVWEAGANFRAWLVTWIPGVEGRNCGPSYSRITFCVGAVLTQQILWSFGISLWLLPSQSESQGSYWEHKCGFYQQAQKPVRKLCVLVCTSVQAGSCWDFVVLGSGQAAYSQTCPVPSLIFVLYSCPAYLRAKPVLDKLCLGHRAHFDTWQLFGCI